MQHYDSSAKEEQLGAACGTPRALRSLPFAEGLSTKQAASAQSCPGSSSSTPSRAAMGPHYHLARDRCKAGRQHPELGSGYRLPWSGGRSPAGVLMAAALVQVVTAPEHGLAWKGLYSPPSSSPC